MFIDELSRQERELIIEYRKSGEITRRNIRRMLELPEDHPEGIPRKVLPFTGTNRADQPGQRAQDPGRDRKGKQ